MRASELATSFGSVKVIELRPLHSEHFEAMIVAGREVYLDESPLLGPTLAFEGVPFRVTGKDARSNQRLSDLFHHRIPRIAWIVSIDGDPNGCKGVLVQVHEFASNLLLPNELRLHVDCGDFGREVRKLGEIKETGDGEPFRSMKELLEREFVLFHPSRKGVGRLLMSVGKSETGKWERGFRIHGPRFTLDVRGEKVLMNGETRFALFLHRLKVTGSRRDESANLALVETDVVWHDAAVEVVSASRRELDDIVRQQGSYLKVWDEYNKLEEGNLNLRAMEFGAISYNRWKETNAGVRFSCPEADQSAWQRLQGAEQQQLNLSASDSPDDETPDRRRDREFVGSIANFDQSGKTITLRPLKDKSGTWPQPPTKGWFRVSVAGDAVRLARRERARAMIESASCPIPWLGMLLEGKRPPVSKHRHVPPLSPLACEPFRRGRDKRGGPTEAQKNALDVALNTPDIAIIQGPPGTGKTRVIAALQARLAELGEGEAGPFGQTLLTSFQHDAVDNVAAASIVFGLPALRVGRRSVAASGDDAVDHWRTDLIANLKATIGRHRGTTANSSSSVHTVLADVRRCLMAERMAAAGDDACVRMLRQVEQRSRPWLDATLGEELLALIMRLERPAKAKKLPFEREHAKRAVQGVPTTPESARDGGPRRAAKALQSLDRLGPDFLLPEEREALRLMSDWTLQGEPPCMESVAGNPTMADVVRSILDRLASDEVGDAGSRTNTLVEEMLLRVQNSLDHAARTTAFDGLVAVEDLINELESDPEAARKEIHRYASTLASTVQQSVNNDMQAVKFASIGSGTGDWPRFRSVIVDEAARCNPLDLMIPMSVAERRIVLVGDHRQLPHMLEPEVERQLEASTSDATREAIGKSLFERLVKHVREMESADGVQRYVRLDTQYRMHPVLGSFVNDSFYAPHGESFSNGRPASDFDHELDGPWSGKVAAWIDVPQGDGLEASGRSKSREAEAARIADEVVRLTRGRPDLSVGVITFYAEQEKRLNLALERKGVLTRDVASDTWIPAADWKATSGSTRETRTRIRVGTVDSFQGMEFDVVFLSLVRSNSIPIGDPKRLRTKYGFLLLDNRVCVAMSRQQRLLIVVGDSNMFRDAHLANQPGVAAIKAFHELCGGPDGVRL